MRRDVFQALADPNRRAILNLLAAQRLTINSVTENFRISQQAVSKHIKILRECGLIAVVKQGRERYCEIHPEKLDEVSDWIAQHRQLWEQRLDRLDEYLKTIQENGKK